MDRPTSDPTTAPPAEDRLDFVSMAASTVVHVIILLIMAMIVPGLRTDSGTPVRIVSAVEEEEPLDFSAADLPPIEMAEAPAEDFEQPLVEAPAEAELPDTTEFDAVAGEPADALAFTGPVPDSVAGADALLADFGTVQAGGGGGGAGGAGFGGEVGRRLARAGAQSGAIQVSLAWNNFNDLDLHVIPPSQEHIFFGHRASRCGGHLDVDMNAGGRTSREPVENVYWPRQVAPRGEFAVYVHHFARHDDLDATPFEVHVLVDGVKQSFKGVVSGNGPPVPVTTFRRRPGPGPAAAETFSE